MRRSTPPSLLLLLLLPAILRAQLPAAGLVTLFPPGGQAGSSVEVTPAGVDLDGLSALRFSHPGITAELAKPGEGEKKPEPRFVVTIGTDVPAGVYEARAVGRCGITNARAFTVDRAKQVVRTSAESMSLEVDAAVVARCTANGMDAYAFDAKKGQRLLIECAAREIDSRTSPVLLLSDPTGREIDRDRRSGLIDFTPPADGRYTVRVHDVLFRGGAEYAYRLSVHTRPRIDAVFPPFGRAGTTGTFTLLGRTLPGGTRGNTMGGDGKPLDELKVEIELPAAIDARQDGAFAAASSVAVDGFAYRLKDGDRTSNAVTIALARADATNEAYANDDPADAQPIDVPCELAGRFYPHGDRDWFAFDTRKGDAFWIEVTSERLGRPTAPFLLVQKLGKEGKPAEDVLESGDAEFSPAPGPAGTFRAASRDPAVRFEAKEDGRHRLMIRDLFNGGRDDATLVYRLSIRRAEPDFRVIATPVGFAKDNKEDPATAPLLRRGGVTPVRLQVIRRDGFDGAVRITADDLPPGVTCAAATIAGGETSGTLLLTAAEDAPGWAGPLRLVSQSKIGDADVTHPVRFGAIVWPGAGPGGGGDGPPGISGDLLRTRLTGDFALAICADEAEPISIALADEKPIEAAAGSKVSIPLKVVRRAELKAPMKLKCAGVAALEKKELTLEPKADGGTLELDLSKEKLPPGSYTFYVQGSAQIKYARPPSAEGKADGKEKKPEAKDVTAQCYSRPITLIVTAAKEEKPRTAEQ